MAYPPLPDPREQIARRYRHFAEHEAPGRSPLYVEITRAVAADERILAFLAGMPECKWQPNLLLGTVQFMFGTASGPEEFVTLVHDHPAEIAAVMAVRRTQTNEPARCATLLPVLAALPQPLALLEVGASAGLCLLPDRYAYDYGRAQVAPSVGGGGAPPRFECRATDATPLPKRNVEVAWRAGLDLDPIDLTDPDEVRWLEALVWPGPDYRIPLLRQACDLARADPPRVVKGDLRSDLRDLAREAPADATLVIFHTAVLAYVSSRSDRTAFARTVKELGAVWVANEGAGLVPGTEARRLGRSSIADPFLLCINGAPVAWTDGHGRSIEWRSE